MNKDILALVLSLFLSISTSAAEEEYYFETKYLSSNQLKLYEETREVLNNWTGGGASLKVADEMINSFIKSDRFFLPIYLERARQTVMMGYVGDNDLRQHDLRALELIKDVQEKGPTYSKAYVLAGHVYTNLKDYQNAGKSLVKAEELGSTDPWLYNNWATLLIALRQYEDAQKYSLKALKTSGENGKALVTAILDIENTAAKITKRTDKLDVATLVFDSFEDPLDRLRIAERMMSYYGGRGQILSYAYQIISRQKRETPEIVHCDMAMVNYILKSGFRYTDGRINQYDENSLAEAKSILFPLQRNEQVKGRVFSFLFDISLSENDFERAKLLIEDAPEKGLSKELIKVKQAFLDYLSDNYQSTIDIYNELAVSDISYLDNSLLASAYYNLGGLEALDKYHLKMLARRPDSAWIAGNYAVYLLFKKQDISSAISYGEKALDLMEYPMAENVTGLAYQIAAANKLDVNRDEAFLLYEKSLEIGVRDFYVLNNCMTFCSKIKKLKSKYEKKDRDRVLVYLLALIGLIVVGTAVYKISSRG